MNQQDRLALAQQRGQETAAAAAEAGLVTPADNAGAQLAARVDALEEGTADQLTELRAAIETLTARVDKLDKE